MTTIATSRAEEFHEPQALVVMGVSGCGKSTVAALLADRLGWPFVEGDDLHPPENVAKMRSGRPLDDGDRAPWLAAISAEIGRLLAEGRSCVVTCSALKRRYRGTIAAGRPGIRFIYLQGDKDRIRERQARRQGHFMPPSLLDSQFAALEEPGPDENALTIPLGSSPPDALVEAILPQLGPRASPAP